MMAVAAHFLLAGLALAALPLSVTAQQPAYTGAYARNHPDAARLLRASDAAYWAMLDGLFAGGIAGAELLDPALLQRSPASGPGSLRAAMPRLSGDVPHLLEIAERTLSLRDEIYDIQADERVADRRAAVEEAVDRYLAQSYGALPAAPKSLTIVDGLTGAEPDDRSPRSSGMARAFIWLQLAAFDVLLYYPSSVDRRAGMDLVLQRFREKLTSPAAAPTVMPTAPAISPELVREHPRAAAILGNLHLLQERLTRGLTDPRVADRRRSVEEAITHAMDPSNATLSEAEWILGSLRLGIYFQGGPAIGSLERSERNVDGSHMQHRMTILPGMGSGPDGNVALPEGVAPPPAHEH